MRFLDDFKFRRTTETNTPKQTEEASRSASQLSIIEDLNSTCSESEVHVVSPETNTPAENKKRKAKNSDEPTDKVLEYLKQKNEQKQHRTMDEADHLFLSYAQSFKKFSPKTQAMLKLDMATLFARYELKAVGETSVLIPVLTQEKPSTSHMPSPSSHSSSIEQEIRPQSTLSNYSTSSRKNASSFQTKQVVHEELEDSEPSQEFTRYYEALAQNTLSDANDILHSPNYQPNYHHM